MKSNGRGKEDEDFVEDDAGAERPVEEEEDPEEIEALEREADGDGAEDEAADGSTPVDEEEEEEDGEQTEETSKREIAKKERARLRDLKKRKQQELEDFMKKQNDSIDADSNSKKKGRLNYLLQQSEVFAHFAKDHTVAQKAASKAKTKGRGRHASKVSEEEEDEEYLREEEEALAGEQAAGTRLLVQPSCIHGKMRDYQLAGLNWLIRLYENGINGILADEMGLGKTLQTISLLGYLHEFKGISGPHMVVAPKSTLGNWINELKRFCPVLRAFKFHGNQDERTYQRDVLLQPGKFDVVVTSFEVAIKEKAAFKRFSWRYIIIDEAHRIKNENSLLAKTMRMFSSNYRLLITGTPLQNNLHELWALLNFLLPEIFSSSETFDEWFQISGEGDQQEVVQQLHKVLRPFLLRRLKSDVERGLPPKKETVLKVGLSEMQKNFYRALLQKDIDVLNSGGERSRLLNIAMQLRKCCNHPYLFQGAEPGPPYTTGPHLVENAGKMVLLDKLLPKLKQRDSRVLIFSQMTRLLDILEDYCVFQQHAYCRIDGNTSGEDREASIEAFNRENSEKFIFLLSTRAGGLGINLATADVVIIYDSDWNPQADLQAMDRAHRIGQKKEVQVFRFCTEATIEEKVIERALKKLALDALVIQQGRLAEQKAVNKDELLDMVRYGAERVFSSKDSTISDEDIDRIIAKGESEMAAFNANLKKFTEDSFKFKMDDATNIFTIGEPEQDGKTDLKRMIAENWLEPPKRERKRNYSEVDYYRQAMRQGQGGPAKPREPRVPRMPVLHDFQFFKQARIQELFEKEAKGKLAAKKKVAAKGETEASKEEDGDEEKVKEEDEELPEGLTEEEEQEKGQLLDEGFRTWSKKDFNAFVRLCEQFGRRDLKSIAANMEGKTEQEVHEYAAVFWQRYKEINDYEKIIKTIEKGEARLVRKEEIIKSLGKKLDRYKNPWTQLRIQYGQNKGKYFDEEGDRFLLCKMHSLGYGQWDELKAAVRQHHLFRFDWYIKSRNAQELARRCDVLIRLVEKENVEVEERERQQRKEQKRLMLKTSSVGPSQRSSGTPLPPRRASMDGPNSFGKRKQSSMENFVTGSSKRRK
eukprot:TRINITY_DN17038_c0_g1_i1.p1 TRINITY_DN17038_c0_g1~~TRINITY_DN17038_c0_g1_i1.p1  ORF type:complete len:1097 (-),score=364.26 TRINITY_DN17038_c0_g1_i1:1012-4302(-)